MVKMHSFPKFKNSDNVLAPFYESMYKRRPPENFSILQIWFGMSLAKLSYCLKNHVCFASSGSGENR